MEQIINNDFDKEHMMILTVGFVNHQSTFQDSPALKLSELSDQSRETLGNATDPVTNSTLLREIADLWSKVIDLREPSRRAITTATVLLFELNG